MPLSLVSLRLRACHPLRIYFPEDSPHDSSTTTWSYYPAHTLLYARFGLFPGRSPLLGESLLFSLPAGTKMFQFPAFASLPKSKDSSPSGCWVVPFGNLGVKGHLRLTQAYRSLSRPSSPPRAKASARRPNLLSPNQKIEKLKD